MCVSNMCHVGLVVEMSMTQYLGLSETQTLSSDVEETPMSVARPPKITVPNRNTTITIVFAVCSIIIEW